MKHLVNEEIIAPIHSLTVKSISQTGKQTHHKPSGFPTHSGALTRSEPMARRRKSCLLILSRSFSSRRPCRCMINWKQLEFDRPHTTTYIQAYSWVCTVIVISPISISISRYIYLALLACTWAICIADCATTFARPIAWGPIRKRKVRLSSIHVDNTACRQVKATRYR